jgi:SAM-dependent methyltransferase
VTLWATVSGYNYYRCKSCQHLFVFPRPSARDLENFYQDATFYVKAENEEPRLVEEARGRVRMLSAFAEKYGLEKSLLDVGCASGIFLEQAERAGWEVTGIELSAALAAKARSKGLNVIDGWMEGLTGHRKYSVVTAWEVIEHAIDPVNLMDHLRSCVQEGGLLAVSTPLGNGLPARILRSKFPMICPPEHLSLFSRQSMTVLEERLGFKILSFRSFSNLKKENLERGLLRYVFGPIALPGVVTGWLSSMIAVMLLPLPKVMDTMGIGSEMEVVMRRVP